MTTATARRAATTRAPAPKKTTTPRKPNPRPASAKAPAPRGRKQASTRCRRPGRDREGRSNMLCSPPSRPCGATACSYEFQY